MESRAYDQATKSNCTEQATPNIPAEPPAIYHRHPNGGGLVSATATVDETVFVGPSAAIRGNATVIGLARLEDSAVIDGHAFVRGRVLLRHFSRISGSACVTGRVVMRQHAHVSGNAVVIALGGDIQIDYYAYLASYDCLIGHFAVEG